VQASVTMLAPQSVYHIGAMRFNETRCDNPPNLTGLGSFTLAYKETRDAFFLNPPTGQVGGLRERRRPFAFVSCA